MAHEYGSFPVCLGHAGARVATAEGRLTDAGGKICACKHDLHRADAEGLKGNQFAGRAAADWVGDEAGVWAVAGTGTVIESARALAMFSAMQP